MPAVKTPAQLRVIERYGESFNFLKIFNPDKQVEYTRDLRRVFKGEAPSLSLVRGAYNEEAVESWLELQLYNLSEFAGCKEKITIPQVEETAKIILQDYGYLNVVEIMLFCQKFKKCEYGKFYGAVDPMLILGALKDFVAERNHYLRQYEKEVEDREAAEQEARTQQLRDLFRQRYPKAFENDEELNFCDFHWGQLYKLTQEEWDNVVPGIIAKQMKSGTKRSQYISQVVDSVIAKRKK
ncbi:MAG: hypothetical protein NC411_02795 [Bacteroides sp.]|nr:hypothetical protein [Bacteroides sp.]